MKTLKTTYITSEEIKEKFMYWYNLIKPYLDENDEYGALKILINWDEECIAKFEIYSLVRHYFKK
jgi:hypothetical protein